MKMRRNTTENLDRDIGFIKDVEDAKNLETELAALQEKLKTKKKELSGQRRKLLDHVPPDVLKELVELHTYLSKQKDLVVDREVTVKARFRLCFPNLSGDYLLELAQNVEDFGDQSVYEQSSYHVEVSPTDIVSKLVVDDFNENRDGESSLYGDGFETILLFDEFDSAMEKYVENLQRFQALLVEHNLGNVKKELLQYLASKK